MAVAATVGDEKIYDAEVRDFLATTIGSRKVDDEMRPALQAEALDQLVNRRLVLARLSKSGYALSDDEAQALLADLKKQLAVQKLTFDEFLARHNLTEALVLRRLVWDAAWHHYLNAELTDERLEGFFNAHRRDYDGTELRVGHILFKVKDRANQADVMAATQEAERVRGEITSGKLTFAKAAEKYSGGPSRRQGGDLGFIPRQGRMVEAFSAAAFALKKGEISPPVATPFGIHLIQCSDIKPGTKTWRDVRPELVRPLTQEMFRALAQPARKTTRIEFTGAMPYYELETRKLVVGPANAAGE